MGHPSMYRAFTAFSLVLVAFLAPVAVPSVAALDGVAVSPQGRLSPEGDPMLRVSPGGGWALTVSPTGAGEGTFTSDLAIRARDGGERRLRGIEGQVFFMADLPAIIALDGPEAANLAGRLRVLGLDGSLLYEKRLRSIRSPAIGPDGMQFACLCAEGLLVLDLRDMSERMLPALAPFALGAGGLVAGFAEDASALRVHGEGRRAVEHRRSERVRDLALSPDGAALFVLGDRSVQRIDVASGEARGLIRDRADVRARDLLLREGRLYVGTRRIAEGRFEGGILVFDLEGNPVARAAGPVKEIPVADFGAAGGERGIAWPIQPDAQHPVGNTYGEYQNYGGAPYPHPGIDVMGSPGQAVFAVRRGVVKAIFTTSGQWHWRIAVGDSSMAGTQLGYLYAHIEESSFAVDVGDPVQLGQYLGDLVEWPGWNFTHCHFTRIEDSGATWDGVWLSVHNPHLDITQQTETEAPVFEPARGSDLLAFCRNQTSTYLPANQLTGAVDIITHVGDRIASNWVCTVQELRYTIYPTGMPGYPIVDDKLSQQFDMTCDTYGSGQIDAMLISLLYKDDATCNTQGDYDYREFFHVLTNSDGDGVYEQSDLNEAWDTSLLPDRDWVVKVTATDVRGNARSDSMVVRTANGNPSDVFDLAGGEARLVLGEFAPNPMGGQGRALLALPSADRVVAGVYDLSGRRIRLLSDRAREHGSHVLAWDGRDDRGNDAPSGSYIVRVATDRHGERSTRLVLVR